MLARTRGARVSPFLLLRAALPWIDPCTGRQQFPLHTAREGITLKNSSGLGAAQGDLACEQIVTAAGLSPLTKLSTVTYEVSAITFPHQE